MELDTFPQFPKLPKEIQILIWEAAVRPVPGDHHVHRFYVADYRLLQPTPGYNIPGRFVRLLRTEAFEYESQNVATGFSLAVPADDIAGNPNDSVYMTDTAPEDYLGQEGASHTASYQDNDGLVKHITIDFDKDLIHLDPRYLSDLAWWNMDISVFLPVFDFRSRGSKRERNFLGDSIALDYDPLMMDKLKSRTIHYLQKGLEMNSEVFEDMICLLYEPAGLTIWFIDYRLVQTSQVVTTESNKDPNQERRVGQSKHAPREVFRSNDFIYTEVKREDIGP
ncbi:hypothetical protein IL306_013237, partial [Fusarium sp. DS 682]